MNTVERKDAIAELVQDSYGLVKLKKLGEILDSLNEDTSTNQGSFRIQGEFDASNESFPTVANCINTEQNFVLAGYAWRIVTAGTIDGLETTKNDYLFSKIDNPSQAATDWQIIDAEDMLGDSVIAAHASLNLNNQASLNIDFVGGKTCQSHFPSYLILEKVSGSFQDCEFVISVDGKAITSNLSTSGIENIHVSVDRAIFDLTELHRLVSSGDMGIDILTPNGTACIVNAFVYGVKY